MSHISRKHLAIGAATVLILGALSFSLTVYDKPAAETAKTVDCRNATNTCDTAPISQRPVSCDTWNAWDPIEQLSCNYTSEDLSKVALISDPGNYVTAPMTDASYTVETRETGLEPWSLRILPSGEYLWTQRNGSLMRTVDGKSYRVEKFDVITQNFNGLMGLELDPDFEENKRIYLLYTGRIAENNASTGPNRTIVNRIVRYELHNTTLSDRKLLFETAGGKQNAGGRLEFGPDGKLYVTSMNPAMYPELSHPSFPGSHVLRVNPDGSVPENNPFNDSRIYSMGHRNPQGLAFNPETGELYSSEHGPWRHDEINKIEPGKNYGWPGYRCGERMSQVTQHGSDPAAYNDEFPNTPPAFCFSEWTMAPSGMDFVDDSEHPWYGDLFVAGLRGNHVHRFMFNGDSITGHEVFYISNKEEKINLRLRDVEYKNGSIYVMGDDTGGIAKITPENY
jgi:glucose/arabinose dehydrogenase